MKNLIVLIFVVLTQLSVAQTELIAYKSHSSDMTNFKSDSYENLGIPPMRIDTIIILNDSTIVEISSRQWSGRPGFCVKDTVVHHPMYQENSDYEKLRGNYYDTSIVFINHDTLTVKQKKKQAKKDKKKNSATPIGVDFPKSNNNFLLILSVFMSLCVFIIWKVNKYKITA